MTRHEETAPEPHPEQVAAAIRRAEDHEFVSFRHCVRCGLTYWRLYKRQYRAKTTVSNG